MHLDGNNLLPFLKGDAKDSPRQEFLYWSDDGDLMALRYREWKVAFLEQNAEISPKYPQGVWTAPFTQLRIPKLYNLRSDPFERGPESIEYSDWFTHRVFILVPAQAEVVRWLESFEDFPPRELHCERCDGKDRGSYQRLIRRRCPLLAHGVISRLWGILVAFGAKRT